MTAILPCVTWSRSFAVAGVAGMLLAASGTEARPLSPWTTASPIVQESEESPFPVGTRQFAFDRTVLEGQLDAVPLLHTGPSNVSITLPMPDGDLEEFAVYRSRAMHPELAAKYPEIQLFAGRGKSTQWRARFELTPAGLSGAIWSPEGRVVIKQSGPDGLYGAALLPDVLVREEGIEATQICTTNPDPETVRRLEAEVEEWQARGGVGNGDMLRTYRAAIGATGEFTVQNGGTVASGLARVGTYINRVNEIMGVDWAVALELVPNNDLVIFTDGATDPYTNGNQNAMLNENPGVLNGAIGNSNYDIGHAFGTGGGGVAQLGVICSTNSKARAASTSPNTQGEGFNLLAAHEMGHQFACGHTFNGNAGNCGPNWSGSSAYEPGSGTTIMSYAGICGSQNITTFSSDSYHTHSYTQAIAHITTGSGSNCPTLTSLNNAIPVATSDLGGLSVPLDTPFRLDGSATDADGDSLLYSWEQYDRGPQGDPEMPVGSAPLFRVFDPRDKTFRDLPKLTRTVTNTHVIGELLPTYGRNMKFRIHVRDGVGGAHWKQILLTADDTAGPFRVTSQATAEVWTAGSSQTVTWDVANSDNAIVNCQSVNILFAEAQFQYDVVLASGVPNNGSATITAPGIPTTLGRVMVQAADNVFYDINDADITIEGASDVDVATISSGLRLYAPQPNPFGGNTRISYSLPSTLDVRLNVYDAAGRLVRVLQDGPVGSGVHTVTWDGTSRQGSSVAPGVYFVRLSTPNAPSVNQKVHYIR